MTHLSTGDLVDAIDGTLDETRASHLATCGVCRTELDELRATLREAAAIDVPEPSPLFWDRFSARVREAIDDAPQPSVAWWRRPAVAVACAAVVALLVVAGLRMPPRQPVQPRLHVAASGPPKDAGADPTTAVDPSTNTNDGAWALLRAAASDMELNDAHAAGLNVRPGSIDRAVLELTPVERTELERLIRAELKRAGA
jgi:hypothetical protein